MSLDAERTEPAEPAASLEEIDLAQGGGPPDSLMPWTLVVESENWSADLAHGAPLPRLGERIEYINDDGSRRVFRVEVVVHTVQKSASERPLVRGEGASPNAIVTEEAHRLAPIALRAGLPRVYVTPEEQ